MWPESQPGSWVRTAIFTENRLSAQNRRLSLGTIADEFVLNSPFLSEYHSVGTMSPPLASTKRSAGRLYLWLGVALVVLGPVVYMIQLQAKMLKVPWYAPTLATLGVALVLFSLARKVTISRIAALAVCGLLAGGE